MAQDEPRASDIVTEEVPMPLVSDEILKIILDRAEIANYIVNTFKGVVISGYAEDDAGVLKPVMEKSGIEYMNPEGIKFVRTFLHAAMSPDKLVTRLSEDEVLEMMKIEADMLTFMLGENAKRFGIDPSYRDFIFNTLLNFTFTNLTSSRRGTLLESVLKQGYERKEIYTPQAPQKQKRFGLF